MHATLCASLASGLFQARQLPGGEWKASSAAADSLPVPPPVPPVNPPRCTDLPDFVLTFVREDGALYEPPATCWPMFPDPP